MRELMTAVATACDPGGECLVMYLAIYGSVVFAAVGLAWFGKRLFKQSKKGTQHDK